MQLYDERVNALRSIAVGSDTSSWFLDFDVLAASSIMNAQEMPDYPFFDAEAPAEQFAGVVEDYSKRFDGIWNFVGGLGVPGLQKLAIWALRNVDAGTIWFIVYGGICAAFTYGEKELAHELIAEFMSQWEERVRQEPSDVIFETYYRVRQDLERLQEAVRRPGRFM
jgi:hypothetical protein